MEHANANLPKLKHPAIDPQKLGVLVLVLLLLGIAFIVRFQAGEERRELLHWQNAMNMFADSRAADIEGWLNLHFHDLGEVAGNPSLQLYLTALETSPQNAHEADEPAQAVFLRNLLLVTADRLGFISKSSDALKSIHANVARPSGTGLAIVDNTGKIIVATPDMAPFDAGLADKIAQAPKGQPSLIDMYVSPAGDTRIGFVLPIYPIQGDATAAQQIGKLVGIKTVGNDFFNLLRHPGLMDNPPEAVLLRKDVNNIVYLSRQKDNAPLSVRLLLSTPGLDAGYAIGSPGLFSAGLHDRFSRPVLMTGRAIDHSPWTLLVHIDRDQALAASNSRLKKLILIMAFGLIAIIASVSGAWWYGTSRRAMLLSVQTGRLAAHSIAQEKLLRLVTDNQPASLFIVDTRHMVRFANERAARQFKIQSGDMMGKDLIALMGPALAREYIEANKSALSMQKNLMRTHRLGEGTRARVIRSEHIPLAHIPLDSMPFSSPGVLVVDQDVTEIVNERERRIRTLRQLIETLVRMVDARDPHAANHSANVALVAREVGLGMGLSPLLVETAQTAGTLMNIGKIIVPSDMLTKTAKLKKDEIQTIRESLQNTVTILQGIEFDGPVVETLRQSQERFDGTGPLGLKGEEILVTARIITVANSFIGMISPRSYRAAIDVKEATSLLLQGIDTQFDRRVVIALVNFVENKQGREMLQELALKK